MEQTFTFKQDWEEDGAIIYKNAKTLKLYMELNNARNATDLSKFDMFCAFSREQFAEGLKKIRPLSEGEKLQTLGAGIYGTKDGIDRWLDLCRNYEERVKNECDPQEVYCYEFNNYESMIAYDGDMNAIRLIAQIWGWEVAEKIKRFCAFYSISHLKSGSDD